MTELAVPRDPNTDLAFVLEGGALVLYYDANVLRTIEFEEFHPDIGGQGFVVWERQRQHEKPEGNEFNCDGLYYTLRGVESLDQVALCDGAEPIHILGGIVRKWINRRVRNRDRPHVRQLARSRIHQYLRPPSPSDN